VLGLDNLEEACGQMRARNPQDHCGVNKLCLECFARWEIVPFYRSKGMVYNACFIRLTYS
jgi:hypothetical protein